MCPTDPHLKYDYLQALKSSGLAVKAAMLTYRHGNNIGNTNCCHFQIPARVGCEVQVIQQLFVRGQ
jgi:hypothetical protein